MGFSSYRSWSHSRQQAFDSCRRRFFWDYFATTNKDDPKEDRADSQMAQFLKRQQTTGQMAGTVIHDGIAQALAQYQFTASWPGNFVGRAVQEFDIRLRRSRYIVQRLLDEKRPPSGPFLLAHFDDLNVEAEERQGRELVRVCAQNLIDSDLLATVKRTRGIRGLNWHPIATANHQPQFLQIKEEMGFDGGLGLRVYTAFDFGLDCDGKTHILDWKTEPRTPQAEAAARRQLSAYALWGIQHQKGNLDVVRVQAVWLAEGPPMWKPTPVTEGEVLSLRRQILIQDETERALLRSRKVTKKVTKYSARREDFPMTTDRALCRRCRYREMCWPDGVGD